MVSSIPAAACVLQSELIEFVDNCMAASVLLIDGELPFLLPSLLSLATFYLSSSNQFTIIIIFIKFDILMFYALPFF